MGRGCLSTSRKGTFHGLSVPWKVPFLYKGPPIPVKSPSRIGLSLAGVKEGKHYNGGKFARAGETGVPGRGSGRVGRQGGTGSFYMLPVAIRF